MATKSSSRRFSWGATAIWLVALAFAWGTARETRRVLLSVGWSRGVELPASEWRLGSPATRELEAFLDAASPSIGDVRRVLFQPPPELGEAEQLALLWAGYLRPERDWILLRDVGLDVPVDFVLCWRSRLDDPRFAPVYVEHRGALYRRRQ